MTAVALFVATSQKSLVAQWRLLCDRAGGCKGDEHGRHSADRFMRRMFGALVSAQAIR
jgi:hypothetical protein